MRLYRNLMSRVGVTAAALVLVLTGCGGSAVGDSGPRTISDLPGDISSGIPDPITTDRGEVFNVTIFSAGTQIYVDKLEIEFNRRRGIHALYGFYRDAYEEMVTIPFRDLMRVDFLGAMPSSIYDQATIGREDQNLRQAQSYELRLTFRDNQQEEFFAIIPKLRGEKDFALWEFTLNNANQAIEYIEFNR